MREGDWKRFAFPPRRTRDTLHELKDGNKSRHAIKDSHRNKLNWCRNKRWWFRAHPVTPLLHARAPWKSCRILGGIPNILHLGTLPSNWKATFIYEHTPNTGCFYFYWLTCRWLDFQQLWSGALAYRPHTLNIKKVSGRSFRGSCVVSLAPVGTLLQCYWREKS